MDVQCDSISPITQFRNGSITMLDCGFLCVIGFMVRIAGIRQRPMDQLVSSCVYFAYSGCWRHFDRSKKTKKAEAVGTVF
jgi:hypothetical protein